MNHIIRVHINISFSALDNLVDFLKRDQQKEIDSRTTMLKQVNQRSKTAINRIQEAINEEQGS